MRWFGFALRRDSEVYQWKDPAVAGQIRGRPEWRFIKVVEERHGVS